MSWRDAARLAFESLAAHRLRSALAMLGVVFGVGAVIAMLSIGAGAERQALQALARLGLENVVVRSKALPDEVARELRKKSPGLTLRDVDALRDALPEAQAMAPSLAFEPTQVFTAFGRATKSKVAGVLPSALESATLAEGRLLDLIDQRDYAQVAVLGDHLRRELFGYGPALGGSVKVDDVWFVVVGVLAPPTDESTAFQGVSLESLRNVIFVPLSAALRRFDQKSLASPLSEIKIRFADLASAGRAAPSIERLIGHLHAGADDFEVVVPEALLVESRRTQRLFNLVMGAIAGISLLVGGIGIMNILLAGVLERTREIGLRRAVGARRNDILRQFVLEAFALSAIGGLLGVLMGVLIAQLIAASAGWPTLIKPWAPLLATGVALGVGLLSGIYPARRAAALDPIEALRHD
jgi:putative ABC transport system permease protein